MIHSLVTTGISAIILGIAYSKLYEQGMSSFTIERKIKTTNGKVRIERIRPGVHYWLSYVGRLLFLGICLYGLFLFTVINLVSFLAIFLLFFIGRTLVRFFAMR